MRALGTHTHVYGRPRVHAKVYCGPGGVAIGSANLSEAALGTGTKGHFESMAVFRDSGIQATADAWFDALVEASGTEWLQDLMVDEACWAGIEMT